MFKEHVGKSHPWRDQRRGGLFVVPDIRQCRMIRRRQTRDGSFGRLDAGTAG